MSATSLNGKVAIITGAASGGIGAATAKRFAQLGAILALLDINDEGLQKVAEECHESGKEFGNPKPLAVVGDISDDGIRETFVEDTLKLFGRIDILFNCAGIIFPTSILTTTMAEYDKLVSVNLRALYDMCRLCAHHLIKTKGSIINVASICSHTAYIEGPVYCLAKAAVRHLTVCLADELGPYNVRAVSISPGVVKTKMSRGTKPPDVDDDEYFKEWAARAAIKRVGLPEDIANCVAFLVSDEASYITGTDLLIDGGALHKRRM